MPGNGVDPHTSWTLRDIERLSGLLAFGLSVPLNVLLLYLILRKTGKELKAYSHVLLLNTVAEIAYAATTVSALFVSQ